MYSDAPMSLWRGGDHKSGNCPAGFIAANGLDSSMAADFYLQSRGGLLCSKGNFLGSFGELTQPSY